MRTKTTLLKTVAVVATAMAGLSGSAEAVDLTADVDANVVTPITVTQDTPMTFGTIAVIPGSDNLAWGTLTLDADTGVVTDPVAAGNGANLIALTGAAPGVVTVYVGANAAIPMTVTVPLVATMTLVGNDDLDVSAITVGTLTTGTGTVGDCSGGCSLTSDAADGEIVFPLGALVTMEVGNGTYGDGIYAGTFTISAVYQ